MQFSSRAASRVDAAFVHLSADLAQLALYDIVIYADDSGSMVFEERGERVRLGSRVSPVCGPSSVCGGHTEPHLCGCPHPVCRIETPCGC